MFWYTLTFLICVNGIKTQPAPCLDDVHCSDGFFCVEGMHTCHECFSCEKLGRSPSPLHNACIKSGNQCGPCLQGLTNDAKWDELCTLPETRSLKKMSSFIIILVTCAATGVLLSLFIMHSLWNAHIIITISSCKPSCASSVKIQKPHYQDSSTKNITYLTSLNCNIVSSLRDHA